MSYSINDTSSYHTDEMESLGWELTVCNTLEDRDSSARKVLQHDGTFGEHLYHFLQKHIDFKSIHSVIEIGGGYGYLMRDLLSANPHLRAQMLDISPFLLQKQRETLSALKAEFLLTDFFTTKKDFFTPFDLAVLNEIIGDFPTVCGVGRDIFDTPPGADDPYACRIIHFFETYSLERPEDKIFTFNLGALEAVEKLCTAGVPYIFISEHSCEAGVPEKYRDTIPLKPTGIPEQIRLKGHDEYTIRFSYLEQTARGLGYRTLRGSYSELIPFTESNYLNFILTSHSGKDEHEIIAHFVHDLFKYEFLFLVRE